MTITIVLTHITHITQSELAALRRQTHLQLSWQCWVDSQLGETIMCSLVEIKNVNEIYIHYLKGEGNTSDRADSIESQDAGDVTINNCALTPISVHTSDIAVQVDIMHNVLPQRKEEFEKMRRTSANSISGFYK